MPTGLARSRALSYAAQRSKQKSIGKNTGPTATPREENGDPAKNPTESSEQLLIERTESESCACTTTSWTNHTCLGRKSLLLSALRWHPPKGFYAPLKLMCSPMCFTHPCGKLCLVNTEKGKSTTSRQRSALPLRPFRTDRNHVTPGRQGLCSCDPELQGLRQGGNADVVRHNLLQEVQEKPDARSSI